MRKKTRIPAIEQKPRTPYDAVVISDFSYLRNMPEYSGCNYCSILQYKDVRKAWGGSVTHVDDDTLHDVVGDDRAEIDANEHGSPASAPSVRSSSGFSLSNWVYFRNFQLPVVNCS